MATFDDMMKKFQQDDPEAYAESMKMQGHEGNGIVA